MSRVFVSPLATPFHSLVSIFPIPSRYISIFRAPPPRYFSPSLTIGCIQSQSCHTNKCPTGVATQDPLRQRALVVPDKAERVRNFHRNTLKGLAEMLAAAGLEHPSQLEAKHLVRRITDTEIRLFSQLHYFLKPGELLSGKIEGEFYERMWNMARADSFDAAA